MRFPKDAESLVTERLHWWNLHRIEQLSENIISELLNCHCLALVYSAEAANNLQHNASQGRVIPITFPWHLPPVVWDMSSGKFVNIQLNFLFIQGSGSAQQFYLIEKFEVIWYCSPLRTKFKLIICGNLSKTVNELWFLYICVIKILQPLVLKPIDFEIITEASLKNCCIEVQANLKETTDLANNRGQGRDCIWKGML